MEELVVLRVVQRRVPQEREGADVGGGEGVAEQIVAAGEHLLEAIERLDHRSLELGYARPVGLRLTELRLDLVRRPLPRVVEPFDEREHIAWVLRIQRRLRMPLVERAHDVHRLDEDLAVVIEHRHERLPAHVLDDAAVVIGDPDRLGAQALEGERQGGALHVRGEASAVERYHPRKPDDPIERPGVMAIARSPGRSPSSGANLRAMDEKRPEPSQLKRGREHDGLVVEIKSDDLDRLSEPALRRRLARYVQQIEDYMYSPTLGFETIQGAIQFQRRPVTPGRAEVVEQTFNDHGISCVWLDA